MQEAGRRRCETNPDRRIHRGINSKAKLSCNRFLGVYRRSEANLPLEAPTSIASQISMRVNKLDYNKVQTFNSLMNKLVPPLVCAAAALTLTTFASSRVDQRSANHG